MKLPPFLRFLEPLFRPEEEGLSLFGHVRVERKGEGGDVELIQDSKNFIVEVGLEAIADVLIGANGGGFSGSIFRMAIGDGGTIPGDIFNRKLPDATWPSRTSLFHEIVRKDIDTFTKPTPNSIRFVGVFNTVTLGIDASGYSLPDKVINEAGLVIGDGVLTIGGDPRQINKVPPDPIDPDEVLVSMRTFKSASFDDTEDVNISVTWTLTVAKAA